MPPSRCRILTESIILAFGTLFGFAFFILGLYTSNYHTIIWGWFSGLVNNKFSTAKKNNLKFSGVKTLILFYILFSALGFCALRVFVMQLSYLKHEFHDKYEAEQLSKLKIIAAYLLLGSIVASAYYLPFAVIYNKCKFSFYYLY
jgi:hypothetical protein